MGDLRHIPRLYLEDLRQPLSSAQMHHLLHVLRCEDGASVRVFNEREGEWSASLAISGQNKRRSATLQLQQCEKHPGSRHIKGGTPREIAFCLIKPQKIALLLEKCTEIGIDRFHPLISEHTCVSSVNVIKAREIVIAASEQCHRLSIPQIEPVRGIREFCEQYRERVIIADAHGDSAMPLPKNALFVIGPEGGFSRAEDELFSQLQLTRRALAGYVLRAETAAIVSSALISA